MPVVARPQLSLVLTLMIDKSLQYPVKSGLMRQGRLALIPHA